VTFTRIEQVAPAAIAAPVRTSDELPLVPVTEPESPQPDKEDETGSPRTTPAGSESVIDAWFRAESRLLFRIWIVIWLVCPTNMVLGENLLLMEGPRIRPTCSVALAGELLDTVPPPPVDFRAPAGIVLIRLKGVEEVTSTETVQEPGVAPT
jgi:hypothetical protein